MEERETRLKRLRMRAWRRGTKEMDLVLGPYADARLAALEGADLDAFESLLAEHDQDLMRWLLGTEEAPAAHKPLILLLTDFAQQRPRG